MAQNLLPKERSSPHPTLALNTKVEEDFVAPITAVRGALEILRDFPDLADEDRQRFLGTALRSCARLEKAIEALAATVYAAGQQAHVKKSAGLSAAEYKRYTDRIKSLDDIEAIEIDFSDFEFNSSKTVNDFYDVIDDFIDTTGRDWYFVVNYRDCSVWPEAWVAFAHRGKKVNVNHSLGTVRYAAREKSGDQPNKKPGLDDSDPNLFESREMALAKIEEMKEAATT